MNHRLSAFDRGVYHKLSRLLDQTPGDILIGDICAAYDPPLDGALAWAAVQRLEEADLVWLSTLHGVVSLSTHAHDLTRRKRQPCPSCRKATAMLSIRNRMNLALQESRLRMLRAWRKAENEAGRPDGLLDFFKAHGICPCCKGNRRAVVGFDGTRPITAICPQCGGTGLSTPEGHVV